MFHKLSVLFKTVVLLLAFLPLESDAQHTIEFNIDNYDNDTIVVGYYVLDRQLVHDTILATSKGKYILNDTLDNGVYILLTLPENEFLQFIVNDKEPSFKMHFDFENKTKVTFSGSVDNQVFQDYVDFLNIKRPKAQELRDTMVKLSELNLPFTEFQKELDIIDTEVDDMQIKIMKEHPDLISTLLLKANRELELPKFDDTEKGQMAQYRYYKLHYFDYIELGNPNSLRTPFLYNRVDFYINKLTSNHPDSIIQSIDSILTWMEPAKETYKFYLSNLLNKYISTKVIGSKRKIYLRF